MPKIPMPSGPISHALPRGNLVTSGWVKTYDAPLLFGSGAWKKEWWLLYLTHIDAFNDKAHSEQFANYLVTKKKKREQQEVLYAIQQQLQPLPSSLTTTPPPVTPLEIINPLYTISLLEKGVLCTLENFSDDLHVPFGLGFQLSTSAKKYIIQTDTEDITNQWIRRINKIVFSEGGSGSLDEEEEEERVVVEKDIVEEDDLP